MLDLLEAFSYFVKDGAYKDVKNMQQFYDGKRVFNIAGKSGETIVYDPKRIRDVEFDLSITENTATPAYRQITNDLLMQMWQAKAITLEQMLEQGDFPFADSLLQSIKTQQAQAAAQQQQMQAQAQGGADGGGQPVPRADPRAMQMLGQYMGDGAA